VSSEPERPRNVTTTGPGPLVVIGLAGLFLGWVLRGQAIRAGQPAPGVSWLAIGVAWFVAAVVAGIAHLTWRTVHRSRPGVRLSPEQGLARLVLGKTIARLAAFALGAFLGIAISNLGLSGENADRVILRALVAALGSGLALAAGLLLEHACRVPDGD
jgi:hypothetical protein